jgi:hypothetical protein
MFYVGFQLVKNVKFLAFSGLAISTDKGETFLRKSKVPVLDRSDEGYYIRAIHTALFEDHTWKIWYAAGDAWEIIGGIPFPQYHIRYLESPTGRAFGDTGIRCVECSGREYRIGRPRVYKTGDRYTMFYTKGTLDGDYMAGYAESSDGKNWTRKDGELGIGLSPEGWDSRSVAYPALISFEDKTYMFYMETTWVGMASVMPSSIRRDTAHLAHTHVHREDSTIRQQHERCLGPVHRRIEERRIPLQQGLHGLSCRQVHGSFTDFL